MGDLFERGEVFLPELVLAADAMTGAAEVCNAALPEGEGGKKAVVVIGTVQGDVHDIGKTIVVAFLRANGYDVTISAAISPATSSSPRPRSSTPTSSA